jgi:hypothetical protein
VLFVDAVSPVRADVFEAGFLPLYLEWFEYGAPKAAVPDGEEKGLFGE